MVGNNKKWPRVPITDLCAEHVDCVNRTAPVVSGPTPFKMIRTSNVRNGFIDTDNVRYVTQETYRRWTRRLIPKRGDVILTREAPLGDVGMLRTDEPIFLGQRLYHFRPDPTQLDKHFLLYALMAPDLQGQISAFGSGATVEHMRLGDIPLLEIAVPSLSIQRRIGEVLSTYDNLILNNSRRIKILEEIAQALYREWFLRFRFPGHEKVKLVDSQLGKIPQGWEIRKLSELVSAQYGYTESATTKAIGPKYLRGMDINKTSYIDWDSVPYCVISNEDKAKFALSIGDVVVIRMADPGKVGLVEKKADAIFASYLIRLKIESPRMSPYFLFYFLTSDQYQSYVTGASTGTTRKSASAGVIVDTEILIPHNDLRERFEQEVAAIRQLLNNLLDRSVRLRRTRDLLLPKLTSGQINI